MCGTMYLEIRVHDDTLHIHSLIIPDMNHKNGLTLNAFLRLRYHVPTRIKSIEACLKDGQLKITRQIGRSTHSV